MCPSRLSCAPTKAQRIRERPGVQASAGIAHFLLFSYWGARSEKRIRKMREGRAGGGGRECPKRYAPTQNSLAEVPLAVSNHFRAALSPTAARMRLFCCLRCLEIFNAVAPAKGYWEQKAQDANEKRRDKWKIGSRRGDLERREVPTPGSSFPCAFPFVQASPGPVGTFFKLRLP